MPLPSFEARILLQTGGGGGGGGLSEYGNCRQHLCPMLMHSMMDYKISFHFQGASFAHICKMTDVFEGSVIRCMRRLEELLRQMCQASKAIGNTELENKFAEGIYCVFLLLSCFELCYIFIVHLCMSIPCMYKFKSWGLS